MLAEFVTPIILEGQLPTRIQQEETFFCMFYLVAAHLYLRNITSQTHFLNITSQTHFLKHYD